MNVVSPTPTLQASLAVGTRGITPGRTYRLRITGPGMASADTASYEAMRITVEAGGTAGDESFPYPHRNGAWHAPIRNDRFGGYVEFRAPASGSVAVTAIPRKGTDPKADAHRLSLEPLGPAVPAGLLRPLTRIGALEQQRCELIDVRKQVRSLVPLPGGHGEQPARRQRVAFIGSRELQEELSFDCALTPVRDRNWNEVLAGERFDYLLIEPVLHVDNEFWRHGMSRTGPRAEMERLLRRCREIGLPIVLWLRVEPDLYEEFSWLAPFADRVYAVDEVLLGMLHAQYPRIAAQLLLPAVQPRLYNPIRSRATSVLEKGLSDKVLMDGWWRAAADSDDGLLVSLRAERLLLAESHWEFTFTRLGTLPVYRWNTLGCVDRHDKALLSRLLGAELFLPDETLGTWRQLQAMLRSAACGSVVLFRDEGSKSRMIEEGLCWHGDDDSLRSALPALVDDSLQRAMWRHRVARDVLEHHSYGARLSRIAQDLSLPESQPRRPTVAGLLVSMRPWLLDGCIERFRRDLYPKKELIIVVHGEPSSARELAARVADDDRIHVHQLGKERSLGACLNYALAQTDAPFWAKFDDDDFYGPRYLSDMMLYQQIAGSDLLAKPPAFIYLQAHDELRWHPVRGKRAWTLLPATGGEATAGIAGGTLAGSRSVLESVPFSELRRGGSDSDFVRRARDAGHDLLVTDPFNFAFFRSGKAGFHTWDTDTAKLQQQTEVVGGIGRFLSTVFI